MPPSLPGARSAAIATADLRGVNRLLCDAVCGTSDLVEAVHASVLGWPRRALGLAPKTSTGGIPGLAYSGVRGVARLVGRGIDEALRRFPDAAADAPALRHREALVAALNGVLGDRLAATGNPLAITPRLRLDGHALHLDRDALAVAYPRPAARLLVMVHGLCMNDLQWDHRGHHHGRALAGELDCSLVHLHYNSGLPIAENGLHFSALLQQLVDAWPHRLQRIAIVGHSMGGLVARAAIAAAQSDGSDWLGRLDRLATLGTPHLGAPLERAGTVLQGMLSANAHSAPFKALGELRSAGIQDLRHGLAHRLPPLPGHVRAHAVAATTARRPRPGRAARGLPGDGLVPVASAFGQHADPRRDLGIANRHRLLVHGTGHVGLLGNAEVHARLRDWLA